MGRKRITDEELIGKEFYNNRNQKFIITAYAGHKGKNYYEVKFIDTGYTNVYRIGHILSGGIADRSDMKNHKAEQDFIGFKRNTVTQNDPYEVIEFTGRNEFDTAFYKVRFTNTGNEKVFSKSCILNGTIKDPVYKDGFIGYKGTTNKGENFEVIGFGDIENKRQLYKVKFEDTGYIKQYTKGTIIKNQIRDPYYKSIYGVACVGEASTVEYIDGEKSYTKYDIWSSMISRCYNPNDVNYKTYGGRGVTVCDRWKCFEYFLEDLPKIKGYDKWCTNHKSYQLDKDILQQGIPDNKKVYSLETCMFISRRDNTLEMHNRKNCNGSGFKGVFAQESDNYFCRVDGDYYGTFTTPEAAANMYNHVARYRGYSAEFINNDIEYMSPLECGEYRSTYKNKSTTKMIYLLENQKHSNRITSISDFNRMITVKDQQKYNSFQQKTKTLQVG